MENMENKQKKYTIITKIQTRIFCGQKSPKKIWKILENTGKYKKYAEKCGK